MTMPCLLVVNRTRRLGQPCEVRVKSRLHNVRMQTSTLIAFSLVALVAIVTPGPTMLLALSNGTRLGFQRSLPGMLGAVVSDIVLVAAVKWVGAAYLAWLGWRLLRSHGGALHLPADEAAAQAAQHTPRAVFMRCFLVAVTNPKGYLFCGALLPQFIDPAAPQLPQYLVIGALFCAIDFTVMCGYAALGAHALRLLHRRALQWLDRCCGAALLALSGSLLLMRRTNP
jgi:threonine/homoserine/homoserine lactone efflux protein